jgi:hypothetical protein
MSDREEFQSSRDAGLVKRPVISALDLLRGPTAPDQPVRTGGLDPSIPPVEVDESRQERAIRRKVAEEVAAYADDLVAGLANPEKPYNQGFAHACRNLAAAAREIGSKEQEAATIADAKHRVRKALKTMREQAEARKEAGE